MALRTAFAELFPVEQEPGMEILTEVPHGFRREKEAFPDPFGVGKHTPLERSGISFVLECGQGSQVHILFFQFQGEVPRGSALTNVGCELGGDDGIALGRTGFHGSRVYIVKGGSFVVPTKYKIHRLSARAVMGYAKETAQGFYSFQLTHAATEKCKASTQVDQDDNALFYQIMDELHGGSFILPADGKVVIDLSEILIYLDFAGIFDRTGIQKKYIDRQKKAECMFRPEGITLDFGSGPHRYLAFERSASMSRRAMLSFIREDFYEPIRRRIMMDLTIRQCQLSKLYAYNGLLMSSGIRVDGIGIDRPNRVIVIDNPTFKNCNVWVITVEDDVTTGSMRKYHRVEKRVDELVTVCFDGEGLISKQYAEVLNKALGPKRKHTSFQIRMPYVKGMLHQVDFKDLLMNAGTMMITDMWGVKHSVEDVDIILTKSMFKGALWLKENGNSWDDYWTAFRKYHHALYITNVSKPKPESQTELNFQFLNTLSVSAEEFRPENLPLGWAHSPAEDSRDWLTKETELTYCKLCADED